MPHSPSIETKNYRSLKALKDKKRSLETKQQNRNLCIEDRRMMESPSEAAAHESDTNSVSTISTIRTAQTAPLPSRSSPKKGAMRTIGSAVGQYVASPVVESMDVNAILEQVDWNEILQTVDVDALFDKIDVNKVLDRVDVNRHLSRVDVNQHLAKVDYDALIQKSNLEDIIAKSTSGVMSGFTNLLRTRMAWVDQWGQLIVRRCLCAIGRRNKKKYTNGQPVEYLPPRPGRPEDSKDVWRNPHELDKRTFGRSVQFRTSGATNRLLYLMIDGAIVWLAFAILVAVIQQIGSYFTESIDWTQTVPIMSETWFEFVLYSCFNNLYWIFLVGCFGRTFGMWLMGLLMVSKSGNRVSFLQVCFQALLVPLNLILFGWLVGFTRRDGAFVSDLIGGVRIVYAWDARHIPEHNAEMAMSMSDFVDTLTDEEKANLIVDSESEFGSAHEFEDGE